MGTKRLDWHSITVEIVSADIPGILSACSQKNIVFSGLRYKDPLTITCKIAEKDYASIKILSEKMGASLRVMYKHGLLLRIKAMGKRPVLLLVLSILFFLSLWLPERVLFVYVEGNDLVPSQKILEIADACGIRFGASRRKVRSEAMKNALLDGLPELQWAGINTKGCSAIISVREREEKNVAAQDAGICSLVAVRDGIIQSGTASAGTLLCVPGQAVKAGDVLVSAYTDCGLSVRVQKAKGEVFAMTVRPLSVITPISFTKKGLTDREIKKYSIQIGKKRINLSKDSGISYTTCDKIYEEYALTLPGGFRLPLSFSVETWCYGGIDDYLMDSAASEELSNHTAQSYLAEDMISGKILDAILSEAYDGKVYRLDGIYLCSEMIARERNEEIIEEYGKNRGEDS